MPTGNQVTFGKDNWALGESSGAMTALWCQSGAGWGLPNLMVKSPSSLVAPRRGFLTKLRACSGHMPAKGHTWQHLSAGGGGPREDGQGLGAETAGPPGVGPPGGRSRRAGEGGPSPLPYRNDRQLSSWSV